MVRWSDALELVSAAVASLLAPKKPFDPLPDASARESAYPARPVSPQSYHNNRGATMFEDSRGRIILAEVISAYSHCPRKAFLVHCSQERGTPHEYQGVLEER